jgi:hypothetical protein
MRVLKLCNEVYELHGWEPPVRDREQGGTVTAFGRSGGRTGGAASPAARTPSADQRTGAHGGDRQGKARGDSKR